MGTVSAISSAHPYLLVAIATVIGLVPIGIGFATAYLKVSIVLGAIRNALGGQQIPGVAVTTALSIGLTAIIMGPIFEAATAQIEAIDTRKLTTLSVAEGRGLLRQIGAPWRTFLRRHAGGREIETLRRLVLQRDPSGPRGGELPLSIELGAFVLTELREAFLMACVVLTPFVLVDLIVANLLVGLGMFMVSPVLITLPLKLAIFVAVDGWLLLADALVRSYGGG